MRAKFLKENHKGLYQAMLIKGTLNKHCVEVENTAYERLDRMIKAMAKSDGLTEEMKNTDPLRWVGMMNNYKSCAEEVILNELIFA